MDAKSVMPQDVVALLMEASKLDPSAIRALVENRVPCNYDLADHPMIPVRVTENGDPQIDMIGLINGLYGVDEDACGLVIANIPADPKEPVTFSLNRNFERKFPWAP